MKTPRETTNSKTALPRELHRLVVDCINHRTNHNATIGCNAIKDRLQPVQTKSSLKTVSLHCYDHQALVTWQKILPLRDGTVPLWLTLCKINGQDDNIVTE